jgi:hypothetical protein
MRGIDGNEKIRFCHFLKFFGFGVPAGTRTGSRAATASVPSHPVAL